MLALGAGLGGPAGFRDPGPQAPGGAELRDGEELVGGRGVAELELAEGGLDAEGAAAVAGSGEGAEVGDAGGQGQPQLLGCAAAGLVVRQGVDGEGADAGPVRGGFPGEPDGAGQLQDLARTGLVAQRVGAEARAGRLGGHPALGVQAQQGAGGVGVLRSGVQGDGRQVEVDAVEGAGSASTGSPPGPPRDSQMEVTPFSRSVSTASFTRAGSLPRYRCRTSQPPAAPPAGLPPRTNGANPGKPVSSAVSGAVYRGGW